MENQPEEMNQISIAIDRSDLIVSPGDQIDFNVTVGNHSSVQKFIELSILGIPMKWVEVSTPVVMLLPEERQGIHIKIAPPPTPESKLGNYPLTIKIVDQENRQLSAEIVTSVNLGAIVRTEGRIGILMQSSQFVVSPGSSIVVPIRLINRGMVSDTYRLAIEGFPASWISTTAAAINLEAGQEKEVILAIKPPRSPLSHAGRNTFNIKVTSQKDPSQTAEVKGILTIAAFSQYSSELTPETIDAGQPAIITIKNQGNIHETFTLVLSSLNEDVHFEPMDSQRIKIQEGKSRSIEFSAKPNRPPLLGGNITYPYTVTIRSSENSEQVLNGEVVGRGLIPPWVLPVFFVICVSIACVVAFFFVRNQSHIARTTQTSVAGATQTFETSVAQIKGVTQTAVFNLTAAALAGESDDDGDGLSSNEEAQYGTDPNNTDTDGDELLDGDEIKVYSTNPINVDTDGDFVTDGEEILRRGTDPLEPDTDNDKLLDGEEIPPCPDPLDPDSDDDGIIDGQDIDPCDTNNPKLTATAQASLPTDTQVPPTLTPTITSTSAPPTESVQPPITNVGLLAFESNREGNPELYILNTNGFVITRLTLDPAIDTQPAWSPDGTRIAFVSNRNGNNEIYLVNTDGTAVTNLTNDPGDDQHPTWSPDGQWIAFSTNREGNQEIYITRIDGSDTVNITNNPSEDYQPNWFVDDRLLIGTGEWISFTTNRDGNQEVYLIRRDGSELINLTNHSANDFLPEASPDGTRITFTSNREGNQDIFIINIDGSSLVNMTNNPAEDYFSTWSPDNQWIAFTTNRNGNQEIYIIRNDLTNLYNITKNTNEDRTPAWY